MQQLVEMDKINFYIFVAELNEISSRRRFNNTDEQFEINNKTELSHLVEKDLVLFTFYRASDNNKERLEEADVVVEQAKCFTIKSIFKAVQFRYRPYSNIIPKLDSFLMNYKFESIDKLKAELAILTNAGITIQLMKENFHNRYSILFGMSNGNEQLGRCIELYVNSDDKVVDDFLQVILSKVNIKRLLELEEYSDNPKFAALITDIKEADAS